MPSVTDRIRHIKQPYGGYLPPSDFKVIQFYDNNTLSAEENVHPSIVGMSVDYLTRFMTGKNKAKAFEISLQGASIARMSGRLFSNLAAKRFLSHINGLDDKSIINACKLVTFDIWYRDSFRAPSVRTYRKTKPDKATIRNIRILVQRGINFFKLYGPVTKEGFTFEPVVRKGISKYSKTYGGYTRTVNSGDGDFLTKDTLWDFKVTKSKLRNTSTLQLLMYWIMGQHSAQRIYKNITKLGIFNPRLNKVYLINVSDIPKSVIKVIEKDVICY